MWSCWALFNHKPLASAPRLRPHHATDPYREPFTPPPPLLCKRASHHPLPPSLPPPQHTNAGPGNQHTRGSLHDGPSPSPGRPPRHRPVGLLRTDGGRGSLPGPPLQDGQRGGGPSRPSGFCGGRRGLPNGAERHGAHWPASGHGRLGRQGLGVAVTCLSQVVGANGCPAGVRCLLPERGAAAQEAGPLPGQGQAGGTHVLLGQAADVSHPRVPERGRCAGLPFR